MIATLRRLLDVVALSRENRRLARTVVATSTRLALAEERLEHAVAANTAAAQTILGLRTELIGYQCQLAARDQLLDECEARLARLDGGHAGTARFQHRSLTA